MNCWGRSIKHHPACQRYHAGYLAKGLDVWRKMGLPLSAGDVKVIEPREPHLLIQNCGNGDCPVVVDVREPWEYRQGHVPGAVAIPGPKSEKVASSDKEQATGQVGDV